MTKGSIHGAWGFFLCKVNKMSSLPNTFRCRCQVFAGKPRARARGKPVEMSMHADLPQNALRLRWAPSIVFPERGVTKSAFYDAECDMSHFVMWGM